MGKVTQLQETVKSILERQQPASSAQKAEYKAIRKKEDELDKKKEQLLDQLSKEKDDDKRGKVQDELHKVRDELTGLREKARELMRKYRGLRSKDEAVSPKEIASVLTALNSSGSMGGKYPIGNQELTARVKSLEAGGHIEYDKHYDKWKKGSGKKKD